MTRPLPAKIHEQAISAHKFIREIFPGATEIDFARQCSGKYLRWQMYSFTFNTGKYIAWIAPYKREFALLETVEQYSMPR